MANSEADESKLQSLAGIFQEGLDLYNSLEKLDEPTNSPNFQINVKKAMRILEEATQLVSLAGLFSRNETADEIATAELQYLLLPALLGGLSMKLTSGDRKTIIDVADVYYKDFLQRCNDYGLSNYEFKDGAKQLEEQQKDVVVDVPRSEFELLRDSVNTRANKIQRFNEQKELKRKLAGLKVNMKNENVDDEIKRNYFLTLIKLFIHEAIDELNSIEMEKPILEHMAKLGKEDQPKPKRLPVQPLRPIIITKDEVQKAVFGAGYPSLPTMTVDEFYEKRVRDGVFPDPDKRKPPGPPSLQEASLAGISLNDEEDREREEEELAAERDDPERLRQLRDRDEFKDDHRRGWGNRMNRS